jgi:hypothetical protein
MNITNNTKSSCFNYIYIYMQCLKLKAVNQHFITIKYYAIQDWNLLPDSIPSLIYKCLRKWINVI